MNRGYSLLFAFIFCFAIHQASSQAPGDVSTGLSLWLKADAGVTESNNLVSTWADQSGNGNDASQGASFNQPTLLTDDLNGNPTLFFDGGSDFITGGAGFYTQDYFIVLNLNQLYTSTSGDDCAVGLNGEDFSGLFFGDHTGQLTNEVLTMSIAGNNYRSGIESTTIVYSEPMLINFKDDGAGPDLELFLDGLSTATTIANAFPGHLSDVGYVVGANGNATADPFDGTIAEVISYSAALSDANRRNVATYLAVKYGLTLDITTQDYTAGGATIYDRTTHGSYNNDIAGIGQDDSQGLLQTSSQSANENSLVSMSNAGSLGDGDFLLWGNDGGALTTTVSNVPGGVTQRMERIWRVDETGVVGTVDVVFDISEVPVDFGSTFNLIIAGSGATMPTGLSSASVSSAGTVSTVNGVTTVTFEDILFNDNEYFTLAGTITTEAPGDVSGNLQVWLRADEGVILNGSNVREWKDRSGQGSSVSQQDPDDEPLYIASYLNGNPALEFDEADDDLYSADGFYTQDYFIVMDPNEDYTNDSGDDYVIGLDDQEFSGLAFGNSTGQLTNEVVTHLIPDANNYRSGVVSTTVAYTEPMIINYRDNGALSDIELYIDGLNTTVSTPNAFIAHQSDVSFRFGQSGVEADEYDGYIMEVISYSGRNTDANRRNIASYLAIKYGITLDIATQDYTSAGTVIYDRTTHGGYSNDIAGIGRDDSQGLDQTASQSVNVGSILSISNANSQDDGDFLVWGNDGAALTINSADVPVGITDRVERIWRIDETNDVGTVDVVFDITSVPVNTSTSTFNLLTHTTATMASASFSSAGTVSSSNGRTIVTFTGIDFNDNDFFSLGGAFSTVTGPGDQGTNLSLWLKANDGPILNGSLVSEWTDRSGSGNSASQPAVDEQPTLLSNGLNGNEVLDFDGTNGAIKSSQGFYTQDIFVVVDPKQVYTSASGDDAVIGLDNGDFNGITFGNHTGQLTNEVLTFAIDDANAYRSGVVGTTISYREPMIINFRDNGSLTDVDLFIDGLSTTVSTPNTFIAHLSDVAYAIGSNAVDGDPFDGRVAEVISYSTRLGDANRRQVSSYLALKYGLTLDITSQDYTAGGVTIYDRTTHGAYSNNITGIGQDDSQALDQTSSTSESPGGLVTMGNASTQDDGDFLLWGNDGGSTDLTASARTGLTNRVTRIWRVDHTNDVGTVDLTFDLTELGFSTSSSYELLIAVAGATMPGDLDVDGQTSITSGTTSTVNGRNFVTFTGVTLNDNEYFTLAGDITQTGPGGVATNLTLWLKADEGVIETSNAVSEWVDNSGNGNNALQGQDPFKPTLSSSAINSNPTLLFDNDFLGGDAGYYNREVFVVADPDFITSAAEDAGVITGFEAGDFGGINLGPSSGSLTNEVVSHTQSANGTYFSADTDGTGTIQFNNPIIINDRHNAGLNGQDIVVNGATVSDIEVNAGNYQNFDDVAYQLGNAFDFSDDYDGSIAEVISYSSRLNDDDRRDVATYLAIKYGITLDIAGANPFDAYTVGGVHIYDDTSYPNDIAGIGMNVLTQGLNQTTSQSVNDGSIVQMSNASDLTDGEYLVWGNDGGANTLTTSNVPAGTVERLTKIWKVDETGGAGGVGTVTISFDITSLGVDQGNTTFNIIISPSTATMPDDLTSATVVSGGTFSTVNGRVLVTFTEVDFADGDFFTIAGDVQTTAPGGVSSGLSVWLRADEGVNESSNLVSSWANLGPSGGDASQGNGTEQPTFVTEAQNFNPVLDFDGDFLDGSSGFYTDDYFIVFDPDAQLNDVSTSGFVIGYETGQASGLFLGAGASGVTNEIITHTAESPGTYRSALNDGSTYNEALIVNSRNNANPGPTAQDLVINGTDATEGTSGTFGELDNQFYRIGNNFTSSSTYNGRIAEVISYDTRLSDDDRRDVSSYLAIKYGITLDISGANPFDAYTAGGVEIYNNGTYANNIAGIGSNLDHALDQTRSESQNPGAIIRMRDASSLGSGDYLIWGKDANSNSTLQGTELPTGFDQRLAAEWQVDVTNTPGTVTVGIYTGNITGFSDLPQNASSFSLLIDDDNDFSMDLISTVTASSFSGDTLIFTGVSFSDNYFFTLAVPDAPAPGDVSTSLTLWLKADDGVTESSNIVSDWTDQSGNNNDAAQGSTDSRPTFVSNTLNGNPVMDFDGTDDVLEGISAAGFSTQDYYVVFTPDNTINSATTPGETVLGYNSGNDNGLYLGAVNASLTDEVITHVVGTYARAENTGGASISTYQLVNSRNNSMGDDQEIYADGARIDDVGTGSFANQTNVDYTIGDRFTTGLPLDGKIAEVVSYSTRVSDAERRDVASYLAIKYGITLDIDGSDPFDAYTVEGGEIYNQTTYDNDIAGIGVNGSQELNQTSSTSINTGAIVTMNNASALSDGDYLVWGNDGGGTAASTSDLPGGVTQRITQIWGVTETGDAGTVTVTLDLTGTPFTGNVLSDFQLIVDTDDNFGNGIQQLLTASTFSSNILTFTGVDFTGATNFGLGTQSDFTADFDGDGIPDYYEVASGTDLTDINNPVTDGDQDDNLGAPANQGMNDTGINGDGITDALEQVLITNGATAPVNRPTDSDGDGIPDYLEVRDGTNPFNSDEPTSGGANDTDSDGIPNGLEVLVNAQGGAADPALFTDSDDDGVPDYYEVINNTLPGDPDDPVFGGASQTDTNDATGSGGDNISDAMENILIAGGATAPVEVTTDTDADGIPDYIEAQTYSDPFDDDSPFAAGTPGVRSLLADYIVTGGSCVSVSGYQWIDVFDNLGNIVFSINPVGNNLGSTCWGVRVITSTDDDVRDNGTDYVLDRNWYITPMTPPISDVYIRFYTLAEEHTDLGDELLSAESFVFDEEAHLRVTEISGVADNLDPFFSGGTRINIDPAVADYSTNGKSLTLGVSSFSSFFPHVNVMFLNAPLPVELISFAADVHNERIALSWSTATEVNNDFFGVERSVDNIEFETLGTVPGAGNSTDRIDYTFDDLSPVPGVNYYRLRQTDFDGIETVSDVIVAVFDGESRLTLTIYPNPTKDVLNVDVPGQFNVGEITTQLIDMSGRIILRKDFSSDSGVQLPLQRIKAGTYVLEVEIGNRIYKHKIIKQD